MSDEDALRFWKDGKDLLAGDTGDRAVPNGYDSIRLIGEKERDGISSSEDEMLSAGLARVREQFLKLLPHTSSDQLDEETFRNYLIAGFSLRNEQEEFILHKRQDNRPGSLDYFKMIADAIVADGGASVEEDDVQAWEMITRIVGEVIEQIEKM